MSLLSETKSAGGVNKGMNSFGEALKAKMEDLNKSQAVGDKAAQDMATGRADDVAQTMLRIEQANVSLQLAMTVRNKAIEAYQEVMRMQV
jgi:flagellar hook-basal body complex protein FliE